MQYLRNILRRMMIHSSQALCFQAETKRATDTTTFINPGIYGRDEATDQKTQESKLYLLR